MHVFVPIFFVMLAIALVLGPIMMLQPNKTERKLAALRGGAATRGYVVKQDPKSKTMSYILPRTLSDDKAIVEWRLQRERINHEGHFSGEWDWQREPTSLSSIQERELKEILASAGDFQAMGANQIGVYVSWNERLGEQTFEERLDEIERRISELINLFPESV